MKTNIIKTSVFFIAFLLSFGTFAGHHGKILTNEEGMTLYTFDKDEKGVSNCYDGCAQKWPPYLGSDEKNAKKGWDVITRKDGSKQSTYKGQPLYTWVGDQKPGDKTGDGVGGVWHIAEKAKSADKPKKKSSGYSY